MSRLIFALAPMGQTEGWCLANSVKLLDIKDQYMFFKFGFFNSLDEIGKDKNPFRRIAEAINELTDLYPDATWIFLGWEVIEVAQQLYDAYPDAEFFIPSTRVNPDALSKFIERKHSFGIDIMDSEKVELQIIEVTNHLTNCANVFLQDKKYEMLKDDPRFSNVGFGGRPAYYINRNKNKDIK